MKTTTLRKVLVMLLALVMVTTSFAGCTSKPNVDTPDTTATAAVEEPNTAEQTDATEPLRIMIWGDTAIYERTTEALKASYPDFFAKYDVQFINGGAGDGEVAEKFRLALAANESIADIIQLNYTQVPEFASAGVLEDLSDIYVGQENNLTDAAKKLSQYDGKTIAIANQVNSKLFYYRADIFEECGVDPTTWETVDQMLADAKIIYDKTGCYILNDSQEEGFAGCQYDMYLMFDVYDAAFNDAEGNYNCASQVGLRNAYELMTKIIDSGMCYGSPDWTSDWQAALGSGKLIGEFTGSWFKLFIPGYAPDAAGKWAACDWPTEIAKGSEAGGSVYVIPNFSNQKEAAKEWMKIYRLDNTGIMDVFKSADRTPITIKEFDEINKYGNAYLTNDYWTVEKNSYGENFTIFNYTPNAMAEQAIMIGWSAKYFSGACTLDECLQGMQDDMTSQIGNAFN